MATHMLSQPLSKASTKVSYQRPANRAISRSRYVRRAGSVRTALEVRATATEAPRTTWSALEAKTQDALAEYALRPGLVPSSSPGEWLPTAPDASAAEGRVLLYRDTNAWCPFCQRVWLALEEKGVPYQTQYIDLRDKPDWYKDMVPTNLVPAVRIDGALVYESVDILLALEEAFPAPALLPEDGPARAAAEELLREGGLDSAVTAGYRFLAGGGFGEEKDESKVPQLKAEFEAALEELEARLGEQEGPWALEEFSLLDVCLVPGMERLAANLPPARGFSLRSNPQYPRLSAWFAALEQREAYQRTGSDASTHNLVIRKIFGVGGGSQAGGAEGGAGGAGAAPGAEGQREAAAKLVANHDAVVKDVLKNAGLDGECPDTAAAVELHIMKLAATLAGAEAVPQVQDLAGAAPEGEGEEEAKAAAEQRQALERRARAVGASTLAFVRNRVSAPRDMSAAAAVSFRAAADELLATVY